MKQRPRIYYTDSQKALMWERWRKGESLQQIAQLFDRSHSSIQRILAETGGITPATRCRSSLALTLAEHEEISRALAPAPTEARQPSGTSVPFEFLQRYSPISFRMPGIHYQCFGQLRRKR
jgi:hypothetical protein